MLSSGEVVHLTVTDNHSLLVDTCNIGLESEVSGALLYIQLYLEDREIEISTPTQSQRVGGTLL